MHRLGQYIVTVTAAALVCGIASGLVKSTSLKNGIRLLSGLLLTIAVLSPLADGELPELTAYLTPYLRQGGTAAAEGEEAAQAAAADIIKAEVEAYILDKACEWKAKITVEVTLSDDAIPVPVAAVIAGPVSPYVRQRLEAMLQTELGISKENQVWTG